ncbi:hypothetical protein LIER_31378 [Lithospermum erythrorhizon]|uniref:BSD domain-containing protein n=1 Tax=Lithospermum erythrorhizon TaxID=34254 RepID=A0AAV3RQR5_LITER
MSWFARSIANSLNLHDEEDDRVNHPSKSTPSSPRGVKEDLSEITQTLSRQFWGVASFLAPPPDPNSDPGRVDLRRDDMGRVDSGEDGDEGVGIMGIRSDLFEIGGRFRSGLSKLSGNIKVAEMAKMATEYLNKAVEEKNEEAAKGVVGVSEDVVAFAKDVAMHPETWLDFPLPEDDGDVEEGFDMSDAQQEHALAVERLAPRLAALRMELCPEHISESFFWKIYFVLLHPKLDKEDAVLLSTPQVMEARALLTSELQNRSKAKQNNNLTTSVDQINDSSSLQHEVSLFVPSGAPENATQNVEVPKSGASTESCDYVMEKHPSSIDIEVVEKSAREDEDDDDDADDWLKEEETSELGKGATETTIPIDNDEDVSFSDLEDDDEDAPSTLKKVNYTSDKDSPEWVQL